MSKVAIVIAHWNKKDLISGCLDALREQTFESFSIIIVDNGSTDGSVELIKEKYPEVKLIELPQNTGFAYPNNLGITEAFNDPENEYIIALNNDTKVAPNYIEELVASAKRHPEAGSIQPKVVNFFEHGIIDSVGIEIYPEMSAINRAQKEKDAGQYEKEEEIFGPSASAALYTRKALEKVVLPNNNYFDEDYFAYYEDVDLAWRLRLNGFTSWYNPKATLLHVHSATGKNNSPFKAFHIHRNQYYNILKDLPFWFLVYALLFMPIRYLMLLSSVLKKQGPSARLKTESKEKGESLMGIVFRSWKEILKNLPMLLRKRKLIQKNRVVSYRDIRSWFKKYRADFEKIIYG